MVLQIWIHDKDWLQVVDVLSLFLVRMQVDGWANASLGDLWQLRLHVKRETTKLFNVDRPSCLDVFTNIFDKSLPDNHVLSFWLQRLEVWCNSLGRMVMFARI